MTKFVHCALLFWLTLLLGFPKAGQAQFLSWQYENILTDERLSGANPDMVVDANGNLHISFWDRLRDRLVYGQRDKSNGLWSYTYLDSLRPGGYRSAIALDTVGKVHVAYYTNLQGEASLRYTTNASGAWHYEDVLPIDSTLGMYGPDLSIDTYVELSLDIAFDPQGQPLISYFDGDIANMRNCISQNLPFTYDLNLRAAQRLPNNSWEILTFSSPRTSSVSCVNSARAQDRFGEFSRLLSLPADSAYFVVTNSLYNHEMLFFQAKADSLDTWQRTVIDSAERLVSPSLVRVDEGFAFSDAQVTKGNKGRILHMAYSFCEAYGLRASLIGRPPLRNFFYTRVKLDSLGVGTYKPFHYEFSIPPRDNHYRTYYSIATPGEDSIYLAYYDANDGDVVLTTSINGGKTWRQDTVLRGYNTNCKMILHRYRDSLFLTSYDVDSDRLLLSSRLLSGGVWVHQPVTPSAQRAYFLGSATDSSSPGGVKVHIAFDERVEDELHYGLRDGAVWSFEKVDAAGEGLRDIDLALDSEKEPWISYVWGENQELRLAHKVGGTWQSEVVNPGGIPEYPSLVIVGDSAHIAYRDRGQKALLHARSLLGSGVWQVAILDDESGDTGLLPDLLADTAGNLHIAYKDVRRRLLRYGYRGGTGVWNLEDVTDSAAFDVSQISLQVTHDSAQPLMAFRDVLRNMVLIGEWSGSQNWTLDTVAIGQASLLGYPLKLLLDPQDNRWLLYNYVTSTEELRLLRRTARGSIWRAVSVLNNQAQIAGTFNFHLAGDDFYIVGRKNLLGDWGIGMLYAPEGVTTYLEDFLVKVPEWSLYPNPARSFARLGIHLEQPARLSVSLIDLQGRKVRQCLASTEKGPGDHEFTLPTEGLVPGLYFCQLTVGNRVWVKKLVIGE